MPFYEYRCTCGSDFSLRRAIAARDVHAPCPACGAGAVRRIAAPRLAAVGRDTRIAHQRNERAAHEPRMHKVGGEQYGHGHAHQHKSGPSRPWMLGH